MGTYAVSDEHESCDSQTVKARPLTLDLILLFYPLTLWGKKYLLLKAKENMSRSMGISALKR
jgi:hypothetical protein